MGFGALQLEVKQFHKYKKGPILEKSNLFYIFYSDLNTAPVFALVTS